MKADAWRTRISPVITANDEKDDLLDTQEDFLIKENKKHVRVKNAYALEVENVKNYLVS